MSDIPDSFDECVEEMTALFECETKRITPLLHFLGEGRMGLLQAYASSVRDTARLGVLMGEKGHDVDRALDIIGERLRLRAGPPEDG